MRQEKKSPAVPGAKQGEEARAQRSFAEPAVWTPIMLQALERGVKGGKWFSLMDKLYTRRNLEAAAKQVIANKGASGVDHITTAVFKKNLDVELEKIQSELQNGTYVPQAIRRVDIPKPGKKETRPLGIPTVRDRIVQTALRNVLEPIFERDFAEHSYGFRPNRSAKDALRRVDYLLRTGNTWVVEVDFKSYFDTIPIDILMDKIKMKISDGKVLNLIGTLLQQQPLEDVQNGTVRTLGTPQGAVSSPLFANIYLDGLDHFMAARSFKMTRYADDLVVQCEHEEQATAAMESIREWVAESGLILHPTKTRIVRVSDTEGFDFLGYHFQFSRHQPGKLNRWPCDKSKMKLRDNLRPLLKRCNGHSLPVIIVKINPILRGFFNYFKHSGEPALKALDGWIRMRLRSILRKRQKKEGRGRGSDHQRWPNVFFHDLRLFSLVEGRRASLQILSEVKP
jgi:RNA-directed DNA polymerase